MSNHAKKRPAPSKLKFEVLESRQMLSGAVQAVLTANGALALFGDAADNGIAITENTGTITVSGLSYGAPSGSNATAVAAGAGVTQVDANTVTVQASAISRGISVNLRGGNDFLSIGSLQLAAALPESAAPTVSGAPVDVAGYLDVDMGPGNDVVFAVNVNVGVSAGINGGLGNNFIDVAGLTVANGLRVVTWGGGDSTVVASTDPAHTSAALANYIFSEYSAGDTALADFFGGLGFITSPPTDLNTLQTVELPTFSEALLSGLSTSFAANNVLIDTGWGNDSVILENANVARWLDVQLREGNDTLNYGTNSIATGGFVALDGGLGLNTLNSVSGPIASSMLVRRFQNSGTFI